MSTPSRTPEPTGLAVTAQNEADRRVDLVIGRLLQIGVFVAAAIVVIGATLFLAQHGRASVSYEQFRPGANELRGVSGIVRGVLALHSAAIIQLGLVLLILTPIARVALTLVAFIMQRDRLYVLITAVVLALLLYSLVMGG